MSRIAIIGWGSLIWDLEVLAPHVSGDWRMEAGPELAMEFARVSPKRKRALAVCLEAEHGTACQTNVIQSKRSDLADAVADLAARERAPIERIGVVCRVSKHRFGADPRISAAVEDWCTVEDWDGAVWTDLQPNFSDVLGYSFTVERAISYLQSLEGESLDEAVRYIELAPKATDTALRQALEQQTWWIDEAKRLGLRK